MESISNYQEVKFSLNDALQINFFQFELLGDVKDSLNNNYVAARFVDAYLVVCKTTPNILLLT